MTPEQLAAATGASLVRATAWLPHIEAAMALYGIDSPVRQAAFLAQVGTESAGLSAVVENLNYAPAGLRATFNSGLRMRFSRDDAERYGRTADHGADQVMIASIAYANRLGNGDVASRDGWRYRGRGPIQITGRGNYARCGAALGIDLLTAPDQLERADTGALSAAWFWAEGNPLGISLNHFADARKWPQITLAINGSDRDNPRRQDRTELALQVLA